MQGSGTTSGANNASNNFSISATKGGPVVDITANGTGGTVSRTSGVPVTDAALPAAGDTRNYTVLQVKAPGSSGTVDGAAERVPAVRKRRARRPQRHAYQDVAGRHLHGDGRRLLRTRRAVEPDHHYACVRPDLVTQTPTTALRDGQQRPEREAVVVQRPGHAVVRFVPHAVLRQQQPGLDPPTRAQTGASWEYPRPNDSLFNHQHRTVAGRDCLTCHVSHGSNAAMTGTFSASFPYPDAAGGAAPIMSGSSRLLKVDNRGTCQACHDPTGTVAKGTLLPASGANTQVP